MRKLGLDIGTRTCGVAITDESEIISSNFETLRYNEKEASKEITNYISQLLKTHKIDGLIVGYPLKIDGTKSATTLYVEKIINHLKTNINVPILLINEQYSTKKAHEIMLSAGLTNQKRKKHKDKIAAQLILDDYIEYYKDRQEIPWLEELF